MSYEINILVVNQEHPVQLPFASSIILQNEVDNADFIGRYWKIWPFFSATKGILYSLLQEWLDDDYYGAYPFCDSFFETEEVPVVPPWIPEDRLTDMTPLIIKEHAICDVKRILRYLLETSPNGFILFQSRYQGYDTEVIMGTISIRQFFEYLENKQIMFNVCYIIGKDENENCC